MKEKEKESNESPSVELDKKVSFKLKFNGNNINVKYVKGYDLEIDVGEDVSDISMEIRAPTTETAQTNTNDRSSRENTKSDNITQSHSTTSYCSILKQSTELTQTFSTRAENLNTVSTDVLEVIPRENETDKELELEDSPKWLCLTTPSAANRRLGTGITHQMSSNATDDLTLLAATLYLICLWFKKMTAKLLRCIPQKDKKDYLSFPAVAAFPESFFSLRETIKNVAATTGNMKWCITTFDVLLTDIFSNNHSYYLDALSLNSLETQMEGELLTIKDILQISEVNMESANNPGIESYVSGLGFKTASCARIMFHSSEHDTGLNIPSPRESVAPSLVTTLTQKCLEIKSTNGGRLHPSDRKSSSYLKDTDRQPADTETQLRTKSNVGTNTTTDGNPPLSNTQHDEEELDKYDKFHTLEKHFTEKTKAAQKLQTEEVDNSSVLVPFASESETANKHAIPLNKTRHETEGSNDSSCSLQSASESQITKNDSAVLGKTGLQTEADEIDSEALTNDRDILNYAPDENDNSRRKNQIQSTSIAETPERDHNKHFGSGEPKRHVCKKGMAIMSRTKSRRVASYRFAVTRKVPRCHPRPCRKSSSTASLTRQSVGLKPCTKLPHNKQAKYGKKNEQYNGSASDEQRWDSKITVEQTSTRSLWSKTLQPLWRQHLRRVHCMRRQIGKWKGRKMPPNVIGVLLEVISMRPPGQEGWLPIQGSTRTFTTSGSESNLSLESEIFPTAVWRPFSSPISAASDHSGSQDKGQNGQNAAQKGPNPHGHNRQKGCHETSVTITADKDDFLSADSTDGSKGRHWLDNQSSSKSTGCLNSEIIQNPPTHIATHVLQGQITGNREISAKSKLAPDVARHSAAAEGQVQDDQKPASSSKYIADNPSPSQGKTSPTIPTSGNVTAVNGVTEATENLQRAGHAVKGEKISEQTTQNDQVHDSNTKRGTTSSANVKSCSIPIAEILEYAGCTMEIIKIKEEIIYELRMGSSCFPLKTIYGLALRCFPDMNQWEIDRLTDPFNASITSRETSVRNVLNEMKARGLKYGHLVQYFSQEDSKRVDILQLVDKIHPTCEHCSYVDTN